MPQNHKGEQDRLSVYEMRHAGRAYCNNTEGSEHYKTGSTEPIDLLFSLGLGEDFCLGSIIKYAARFSETRNKNDLKKASDYAQILCGYMLRCAEALQKGGRA